MVNVLQDVEDGQVGILEVSLDGITVKFKNKKVREERGAICIKAIPRKRHLK